MYDTDRYRLTLSIWYKSHLLVAYNPLYILLCLLMRGIGLEFSFPALSLSGLGIRVMLPSGNELERVPTFSIFWTEFLKYWYYLFFEFSVEFINEAS